MFGKSSERFISSDADSRQEDSLGEKLTPDEQSEISKEIIKQEKAITKALRVKKDHKPRQIMSLDNLRVEEITIDIEDIDLNEHEYLGVEISNSLAFKPSEVYIKRIIRKKYALKDKLNVDDSKSSVIIAALPHSPIYKCMADTTLLTELVVQKYLYHMPFYRQILRFKEMGVTLSSSTIGDWFDATCTLLRPLYDKLREEVLSDEYIQVDESTLPVISKDKHRAVKGYLWVVRAVESGSLFFHYDGGSRSGATAMALLGNYNGVIQSDGYQGYNSFENMDGKLMLGCWAHARRKFEDALAENKELSSQALCQIQQLYGIEREADKENMTLQQRKKLRKDKSYPILCLMEKWLYDNYKNVLPQSRSGKAIAYTYTIFPKLSRYHLDGRYKLDNNLIENCIRPLAIGRKNYMFCGNGDAAIRASIIYSLFGTRKAAGVNVSEWMNDIMLRLPNYENGKGDIAELLPHRWAVERDKLKKRANIS